MYMIAKNTQKGLGANNYYGPGGPVGPGGPGGP